MSSQELPKIDQSGIPTNECINCGSQWFQIHAFFQDYEIAAYIIEAKCSGCGADVTAPTPIDHPDYEEEDDDEV